MSTRTRILLVIVALASIGTITAVVVSGGDDAPKTGPATSGPTTSTTTSSTTPPPTPLAPPPAGPTPDATPVDASGAVLSAPPPPATKSSEPPAAECHALGDTSWSVEDCAKVAMAGGERVWLTEHKPVPGSATEAWRAYVLHWSQANGGWVVDLLFEDDAAAQVFDVNVLASDLTGDGKPELVFGFHYTGTGSILGYDVVTDGPGASVATRVHRELSHGAALVADGKITDYDARYPNGEPNCCPAYTQRSTVSALGGTWYVTPEAQVESAGPGNL